MIKFALIGNHLTHSCSPIIYNYLFEKNQIEASYEILDIEEEKLSETMALLKEGIYQGFNVTIPYKEKVIPYLDELSEHALKMGAVNVIVNENGKLIGHNTDYSGFIKALKYQEVEVQDQNCYVLGNGGAAKAIIYALKLLGGKVTIVNRKKSETEIDYEDLKMRDDLDLIVNTTPVGMYPKVDFCPIDLETIKKAKNIVDIIYNPRQTKLLKLKGVYNDGLPMLIFQALDATKIWFKKDLQADFLELISRSERKILNE